MGIADEGLPSELQTLLRTVVGMPWPEGSIAGLRELSAGYGGFEERLTGLADRLRVVAQRLGSGMDGTASDAFVTTVGVELPAVLAALAESAGGLTGIALDAAADIEEARIMIVVQLVILAAALIHLASTLLGWVFIPLVTSVARAVIRTILAILIETLGELALGVLLPLFIELGQVTQRLRTHVDGNRMLQNVLTGLVGGVAVGAFRGVSNAVTGWTAGRLPAPSLLTLADGSRLARGTGFKTAYVATNVSTQGVAGVVVAGAEAGITGQAFNWGTVTSSALSEAGGALDSGHAEQFLASRTPIPTVDPADTLASGDDHVLDDEDSGRPAGGSRDQAPDPQSHRPVPSTTVGADHPPDTTTPSSGQADSPDDRPRSSTVDTRSRAGAGLAEASSAKGLTTAPEAVTVAGRLGSALAAVGLSPPERATRADIPAATAEALTRGQPTRLSLAEVGRIADLLDLSVPDRDEFVAAATHATVGSDVAGPTSDAATRTSATRISTAGSSSNAPPAEPTDAPMPTRSTVDGQTTTTAARTTPERPG